MAESLAEIKLIVDRYQTQIITFCRAIFSISSPSSPICGQRLVNADNNNREISLSQKKNLQRRYQVVFTGYI